MVPSGVVEKRMTTPSAPADAARDSQRGGAVSKLNRMKRRPSTAPTTNRLSCRRGERDVSSDIESTSECTCSELSALACSPA
jgi:hypothetical protein